MNEVIISEEGTLGHITLNRPEALNALTLAMILAIRERLESWTGNPCIAAVLLDGAGERGLCAGGDIRALYGAAREGATSFPARYWREEYTLNLMIARYPKPIVAVMDGIVMGGGIGLSAHASHRLVTERSILAMPEVGIGFFPDVGGTWLLSRAPGLLGLHVALTAASLGPADAILVGLADLFIAADRLAGLAPALLGARSAGDVSELLSARAAQPPPGKLAGRDRWINVCYAKDSVEEIVACLQQRPEPDANHAAAEILRKSPTALKVTFRALREAAHLSSLAACLDQEYRLALASVRGQDFLEGVRAAVIDKDRSPCWSPARLEDVTPDLVAARFDRSGGPELGLAGCVAAATPGEQNMDVDGSTYETILVEREGAVGLIRLNRPQALNALNLQVMHEVTAALSGLDLDPAIGCIVITGSEKAFAAGADIKEMQPRSYAEMYAGDWFAGWDAVGRVRTPLIAAVAGFALGGGCELAMMCDIIFAADNARFGQPEIKLGVIPGMGGSQRLTRAIGKAKAMELCLTGRMMDALEAERSGLVARVVPAAKLLDETLATARTIAGMSRPIARMAKEVVNRAFELTLSEGIRFERRVFHATFATHDQKEGMTAFIEKRAPRFTQS